jgi:HSP20 family protein
MNVWFPLIRSQRQVRFPELDLFDRLFSESLATGSTGAGQAWTPAIDVAETPREIVVKTEVPGMTKDDLDITLSDGLLTIRGEKRAETRSEDACYLRVERRYGSFSRTLRIPETVDVGTIDASYKDGLLTVRLPKQAEGKSRRVSIQTPGVEEVGQQN